MMMNTHTSRWLLATFVGAMLFSATSTAQQVGPLLWEENFNTLDTELWNVIEGNGCQYGPDLCGWGNQELQYYLPDSATIEPIPGESGNSALVLTARNQTVEGSAFTSGKLDSQNKVSIQYGLIEARIRVPNLDTGLWPAFWMLGTSTASWPAKGEIDIMEMGHRQAAIDEFYPGTNMNSFTGSNLIFYADDACVPENPTCAAMTAWQTDNAYVSSTPMNDRFVTYRFYWTEESMRFAVVDNGVEYDMYDAPIDNTQQDGVFKQPFYLLMNLAVGGSFTDALQDHQITAPLPAKMYVDYVRVYQLDGQGEVMLGNTSTPETGTFGVFTDSTPVDNGLEAGTSSDIYVWSADSLAGGSEPAYEGDNVISWDYVAPGQWFGGGIQSRQPRDMSNFAEGNLRFRIKVPANVSFRIGVTDTYTNENYISFAAGENQYGLVRNGEWGEVSIPVADLRGEAVALQSMQYLFALLSEDPLPGGNFALAIDDIIWEGGGTVASDADADGTPDDLDLCPNTPAGSSVNSNGCALLPMRLQAQDYSDFYDTDAGNAGGAYRSDDVDIEATDDITGDYNVGWTEAGEWLEYTTTLAEGTYEVSARVASLPGGGLYSVEVGSAALDSTSVDTTGGWQSWTTQTLGTVTVGDGPATVRLNIQAGAFNINWIHLEPVIDPDSDGDGVPDSIDQCANTPTGSEVDANGCALLPVRIQAQDYSAFFDTDAGNTGGTYRNDDVDIEAASDVSGDYNVGWTEAGEWLEYTVTLAAGTYEVSARVASLPGGGLFDLNLGGDLLAQNPVAATGGWQSWATQTLGTVTTSGGPTTLRLDIQAGSFNINWLHLEPVT
ncbi:MAG TPA: carbohydrate-binding domain-containing protein, partial [Cellvibrionaceae bacterium]